MRKLLNTLYVTDETVYLSLDGENIVCLKDGKDVFRIPFANIESVCCFGYMGCSPALMGKCADYGITINFMSPHGKFLARVTGSVKGNVYLRKQQLESFSDSSTQLKLIRNTIAAKLANTRFVMKRTLHDYPETDFDGRMTEVVERLAQTIDELYSESNIDILRGMEGSCAKVYFDVFERLIRAQKSDFTFSERNKRPPLDRINAVLSFLYSLYTNEYASALEAVGLDPYIGFFHALRSGRCSLACDLVEEGRAIVERLTLTMINLKIIDKDDFRDEISGAVYLNDGGRRKVLTQWQDKKRSEIYHPILKEKIKLGLLPFAQASLLARFVRGDMPEYTPYLLR